MARTHYRAALRILIHFLLSAALIAAFSIVLLDWGSGYTTYQPTAPTPAPHGPSFNPQPTHQ